MKKLKIPNEVLGKQIVITVDEDGSCVYQEIKNNKEALETLHLEIDMAYETGDIERILVNKCLGDFILKAVYITSKYIVTIEGKPSASDNNRTYIIDVISR